MRYGKVTETIWTDDKFKTLGSLSKLLFIYLLSCSKCNSVGIFQIGLGTIEDEFGSDRARIKEGIAELQKSGLAHYESGWFYFNKFLKWNAPVSPNHARQIASVLNECVMQNAPKEAVCSFLGSAYGVLNNMKYKQGDQVKTYYAEFKSILDENLVDQHLGGTGNGDIVRSCLKNGTCSVKSTPQVLQKDLSSTAQVPENEVLPKCLASTGEVLGKDSTTQTRNRQETDTYTTRNRTDTTVSGSCHNTPSEFSALCSDGQTYAVGQSAVRLAAQRHPDIEIEVLINAFQKDLLLNENHRPTPDLLEDAFLNYANIWHAPSKTSENRFLVPGIPNNPPEGRTAVYRPHISAVEG